MDPKLLELLVCPVTKGPLDLDREKQELISRSARLAYPIRDGIPIMLEGEARAVARGVAHRDHPVGLTGGQHPDGKGVIFVDVAAERARQDHSVWQFGSVGAQKDLGARPKGSLGQLDGPDVFERHHDGSSDRRLLRLGYHELARTAVLQDDPLVR